MSTATGVIDGARFQAELREEEQQSWTAFFAAHDLQLDQIKKFEVKENGDVEVHVLHRDAEGRLHLEGHCDLGDGALFMRTMLAPDQDPDSNINMLIYQDCACGREPTALPEHEVDDPYSHETCTNTIVIRAIG